MKLKASDLNPVCHHCLGSRKDSSKDRQEESHGGIGVIANGRHVNSHEKREEGEVGLAAVPLGQECD